MNKVVYKFVVVILLMLMSIGFVIPVSSFALREEIEMNASKGDIYNPQTDKLEMSATINADNGLSSSTEGFVQVQKIVNKVKDIKGDIVEGEYNVEFKIRGNNTKEGVETVDPVYVVVVLDASNSMNKQNKWENAKKGVEEFTTQLLKKIPTAQIALVKFAGRSINDNWADAEVGRFFKNEKITDSSIGELKVGGGGATNLGEGLRQAYRLLNNQKLPSDNLNLYNDSDYVKVETDAKKYVVVLSDGIPTLYTLENGKSFASKESNYATRYCKESYDSSVNWANKLKNELSADIITIGYELDKIEWTKDRNKAYELLDEIASRDSFVIKDTYISDIINNFKNVSTKFEVEFNAGSDVLITDNLGSAFNLSKGNTTLNLDKITQSWASLGSFNIAIDKNSLDGWYPTNNGFKVLYKDYKGEEKQILCNDNPLVLWEQERYEYRVNYYFNGVLDNFFTKNLNGLYNSVIYAKDNYLEDLELNEKNKKDNTSYFLDFNNSSNSSNITVTSIVEDNVLNIYYVDTTFDDEKINKGTDVKVIEEENMVVPYIIDYSVDINNIKKGDNLITVITDTLPYTIDVEKSNLNGGVYDKQNKTITWVFDEIIDSFKKEYNLSRKIEYSVIYKDFSNISSTDNNDLINKVEAFTKINDKKTNGVVDSYSIESLIKGKVIVNYVTKDNKKLADSVVISDLVGSKYQTIKKDFNKYSFIRLIGEVNGFVEEGTTEVTYVYDLIETPPHTDINIDGVNNYFKYICIGVLSVIVLFMLKIKAIKKY